MKELVRDNFFGQCQDFLPKPVLTLKDADLNFSEESILLNNSVNSESINSIGKKSIKFLVFLRFRFFFL